MMERISSGENLLGFNIFNSYAALRAKKDPSIGIVLPKDYTLIMSRVMFASKTAKNPNAAKLWVDYILRSAARRSSPTSPSSARFAATSKAR
jgi:ABC-type Fe3+ transport system, periplasmic component